MSSNDIAISIKDICKSYEIYDRPSDRLRQFLMSFVSRLTNKKTRQYFRNFWALRNISFEIKKGETFGIIGLNGSGKSTLLQIICGTLTPTSGSVEVRGRVAALLELGSGFNPEFTGRENVYMNASVLGLTAEEISARFKDIEKFADIGDFIDQPVKAYSSGMMVRLAFAVIAHVDADILVVDEALAVGDAFFTQKCMRFLRKFMENGTVLFVTHDTAAVVNLCSQAVLLNRGKLIEIGMPKEVSEHYLAALYEVSQDVKGVSKNESLPIVPQFQILDEYKDMRDSFINSSNLRNDIEIFQFKSNQEGFGTGQAKIVSVRLLDQVNTPLSWIVGGENVVLDIRCVADKCIQQPIVGFQFKDRLGQVIFTDNTFLAYQSSPLSVSEGSELIARFEFRLPILPSGDYSFTIAFADGSQDNHVQHHWIYDALVIRVHASSICSGLVGVPMRNITLAVL